MSDAPTPEVVEPEPWADPQGCPHLNTHSEIDVIRITDDNPVDTVVAFQADIRIRCEDCGDPFVFVGLPAGLSYYTPSTSPNGEEMRAPIAPRSHLRRASDTQPAIWRVADANPAIDLTVPHVDPKEIEG